MDRQNDPNVIRSAMSLSSVLNDYEEEPTQTDPLRSTKSPSPLFCSDEDAGKTEPSSVIRSSGSSAVPEQKLSADSAFLALPVFVQRYTGPDMKPQQGINPIVSNQTGQTSRDAAAPESSDLSDLGSQTSSDDDMKNFIVPDNTVPDSDNPGPESDPEDKAAARASRTLVGMSSGLVKKEKIGTTGKGPKQISKSSAKKTSPCKKKPGSRLLKELESHMEDIVKPTRDNLAGSLFNYGNVKLTRNVKKELDLANQGKCPSPRRTYNVKALMDEQNCKVRGRKVFYQTNEETKQKSPRYTTRSRQG